jgi:antirestriction protein ArdC
LEETTMTHDNDTTRTDIYDQVTRQIIEAIEAGCDRWRMPWHTTGAAVFSPQNVESRRNYRGVNLLCLWVSAERAGYSSGTWGTFRQWQELGGRIRRGERATSIVFWKTFDREPQDEAEDAPRSTRGFIARGYGVFNADQVEGYEPPRTPTLGDAQRIAEAEAFFRPLPARVHHGTDIAFYARDEDAIWMPRFEHFRTPEHYYGVLAHELTHWTGAAHRLGRDLSGRFGSTTYAAEELVAELGAAFLASGLGLALSPRDDHAAYIGQWLDLLKGDKRAIFTAAGRAQRAVDYLLATHQASTLRAA